MAKAEHFNLKEFKDYAKTLGFTKITHQAEGAHAVSLESWNGVTTEAGSGYSHIGVWYQSPALSLKERCVPSLKQLAGFS
jgi:hypothetical protein